MGNRYFYRCEGVVHGSTHDQYVTLIPGEAVTAELDGAFSIEELEEIIAEMRKLVPSKP